MNQVSNKLSALSTYFETVLWANAIKINLFIFTLKDLKLIRGSMSFSISLAEYTEQFDKCSSKILWKLKLDKIFLDGIWNYFLEKEKLNPSLIFPKIACKKVN